MFNLIMLNIDWTSGRASIPISRIFEYTADEIIEKFGGDGSPNLEMLSVLPCLFLQEGTGEQIAYTGSIRRARLFGGEALLEVIIDNDIPSLRNRFVYQHRRELSMPQDFEFSRNHWAVKDVDLYLFLLHSNQPRRRRPSVFRISEHESIRENQTSAMMPFDAGFKKIYRSIKQAAEAVGLECNRADDIWEDSTIIQDVVSLIDRSRIVICDCTGRNPNVFYEIGIAHSFGRDVILITQNAGDIPFDLRHIRYIRYLNNTEGLEALAVALQNRMQTILGDSG